MRQRPGFILPLILAVMAVGVSLILIVFYLVFRPSQVLKSMGGGIVPQLISTAGADLGAPSGTAAPISCADAKLSTEHYRWVKQASKQFLGGDEAALIALVTIESRFNPTAISNTGAVGIGQFIANTARGVQTAGLFRNLRIVTVPRADTSSARRVTDAEKQAFRQNYPYEGRLQPGPSLMASSYYFGAAVKRYNGDLRKAYADGYNRSTAVQSNGRTEKENAADRYIETYNKIKKTGCQAATTAAP